MYLWRQMTPQQRAAALRDRRRHHRPWHGPPHFEDESGVYLITAACYEHRQHVGKSTDRMARFEAELLQTAEAQSATISAWVVLANHYHLLLHVGDVRALLRALGRLHGRTAFQWNTEENCRGRHVWHRAAETAIKSEGHYWASLNYVLHNPVRHGYVGHWQDWPYSNAAQYLAEIGRELAERRWRSYPLYDYGNDWDPPEL